MVAKLYHHLKVPRKSTKGGISPRVLRATLTKPLALAQKMNSSTPQSPVVRFGTFEADLNSAELRKNGAKVKIQELPFRALKLFVSRPNETLSR